MQTQPTLDQRQHTRRDASLLVSYRSEDLTAGYDVTQTRNVSQGGMLLTTARAFASGARLAIWTKLPLGGLPRLVLGTAEAVESKEIVQSLLYETRVRFVDLDRWSFQIMGGFCAEKPEALAATGRRGMWGRATA